MCDCCGTGVPGDDHSFRELDRGHDPRPELEAMYEEVDWVSLEHLPLPARSRRRIASQVETWFL